MMRPLTFDSIIPHSHFQEISQHRLYFPNWIVKPHCQNEEHQQRKKKEERRRRGEGGGREKEENNYRTLNEEARQTHICSNN